MKNWRPFLLGLVLLECGVIGFVGTLIACACRAQRWSILACVSDADWPFVLGFAALAIAGVVIAIREAKKP